MNDTFSVKRFSRLFKKTLLERPTQMFGFFGLILAFIFILYFILKNITSFNATQNIVFIWGFAGGGCILASFIFGYFSSNANGSSYLTLPASHLEKWLCGMLIAMVIYPLIFLFVFRLIDAGFVSLFHKSLDPESPLYLEQYRSVYLFPFTGRLAMKVYPIFLIFTGIAMLGSLYFNKAAFIKTALVFCAVCFAIFALNWLFGVLLFGKIDSAFPFRDVEILVGKEVGSVELPQKSYAFIGNSLNYFIPVLLWAITFIRLREKEF
jgi:hypothetical protein